MIWGNQRRHRRPPLVLLGLQQPTRPWGLQTSGNSYKTSSSVGWNDCDPSLRAERGPTTSSLAKRQSIGNKNIAFPLTSFWRWKIGPCVLCVLRESKGARTEHILAPALPSSFRFSSRQAIQQPAWRHNAGCGPPCGKVSDIPGHQVLRPRRLGAFQKNVIIRIGAHSHLLCRPDPETCSRMAWSAPPMISSLR